MDDEIKKGKEEPETKTPPAEESGGADGTEARLNTLENEFKAFSARMQDFIDKVLERAPEAENAEEGTFESAMEDLE